MNYIADINGVSTSLSDSPCTGRCSTTWGDITCRACGRTEIQIRDWNKYSCLQKKLINLKNSTKYEIRQKIEFKKMAHEDKIKDIENKLFAARCLVEMIGDQLMQTYGKDPIIKETYKQVFQSLEALQEAKKNLPVELEETV
tara:strand:+ start:977 stop:1402 length:426 start_codon:yes stop_codon:yes gene_type:complete